MEVSVELHAPATLYPGKETGWGPQPARRRGGEGINVCAF
jgi:hypothetical protein